ARSTKYLVQITRRNRGDGRDRRRIEARVLKIIFDEGRAAAIDRRLADRQARIRGLSKRRAPDVARKGRLVTAAHRAHAEFLLDEVEPRGPHVLARGGVEIERCHERPPFAPFGPGTGKIKLDRHFSSSARTVKPKRPFPSVRTHDRNRRLDRTQTSLLICRKF